MSAAEAALAALTDLTPGREAVTAEVLAGLAQQPKMLPSKYFYDARGSALFEQITRQPEYYLTRTELALLQQELPEIVRLVGAQARVVEYGSGSGRKTRLLLRALPEVVAYTPIEISRAALIASIHALAADFPALEMLPVCADFTDAVSLPQPQRQARRTLVFFPGSTLGNFTDAEAVRLLRGMHQTMGETGLALIGIDLVKEPALIEAAYNDAAGITAAFTLNLLTRLNREIGSDFDPARFRHRARYSRQRQRIETELVSEKAQSVQVAGHRFDFAAGEAMRVEYSHKYSDAGFAALAAAAGLRVAAQWTAQPYAYGLRLLQWQ
jgi:L-histidine N-alpha-methyltransferase